MSSKKSKEAFIEHLASEQLPDNHEGVEGENTAPEGESTAPPVEPLTMTSAVRNGIRKSQNELLELLFDSKKESDETHRAIVSQYLSHGSQGQFESSSPTLTARVDELLKK